MADTRDPHDELSTAVEVEESPRIEDAAQASPADERVQQLLEHTIDVPVLASAVERQEAADAADVLEDLADEDAVEVIEQMQDDRAAATLAEMELHAAAGVIQELLETDRTRYATRLLELMAPDDAADLLQELEDEPREELLASIPLGPAIKLRRLLTYDEESAGGLMTTDYVALNEERTVAQAIEILRMHPIPSGMQALPVVDGQGQLHGVISLHTLVISQPNERIADLMTRSFRAVRNDTDQEDVARAFHRYDHSMLPVVDAHDRLLGIVTVDDVIDIIREEQTEDVQKTVGAGAEEAVYSGISEKMRGRMPWLVVSLITTCMAAVIVLQFEQLISELPLLAVCMPVIAAMVGNAGHQSLAVTMRGIVLDQVRRERVLPLIVREGVVGLLNGAALGAIACLVLMLLAPIVEHAGWQLGLIAGASMAVSTGVGTIAGSGIPLMMRRFGIDPATASAIFLVMITDAAAFATFLGCAQIFSDMLL